VPVEVTLAVVDGVGDVDSDAPGLQLAVPVDVSLTVVDGVGDTD
jgi:hypothetical protein